MKVFNGVKDLSIFLARSVMTIGNFDGVHLGHRKLLSQLVLSAKEHQAPSVVMTFSPHPRLILSPSLDNKYFYPLFNMRDQENILEQMGVDYLIVEPFSKEFAQVSADLFFKEWIDKPFSPQKLVVGYDFAFGARRQGTLAKLKAMASHCRVEVQVVPPVMFNDKVVGSSLIRKALLNNDVALAAKFLGRYFYLEGYLQKTRHLRKLVLHLERQIPFKGVFQTKFILEGTYQGYPSIANIKSEREIVIEFENVPKYEKGQKAQLLFLYHLK